MAPPTDFFASLRPRSRRKPSEQLRPSETGYTSNNWVELDHRGNGSHINVNAPDQPDSSKNYPQSTLDRISNDRYRTTSNEMYRSRMTRLNDNEENIDPQRKISGGGKLKRRSMQLLRMVERKTSSTTKKEKDELKMSIRHPAFDEGRGSYECSMAGPSKSNLTPTPPHTPLTTPYLPSIPNHPSPQIHNPQFNHSSKHLTPIPANYSPSTPEYEYPSWIGDSDSSGRRTTLKPLRSKVPFNTPNDSPLGMSDVSRDCNISPRREGRRRSTFEELINLPLPCPNGEPSRYNIPRLKDHTGPDVENSRFSKYHTTNDQVNYHLRSSLDKMNFQDETSPIQDQPIFESSSALEALWEYGSTSSSSSALASQVGRTTLRVEEETLDLDIDIDAEEYPLPPGFEGLSNLPTQTSLSNLPTQTSLSRLHNSTQPNHFPLPDDRVPNDRAYYQSCGNLNLEVSSPLSDTFSLDEEEEEEVPEIKAAIKYRIPLKYEGGITK
ncbi:hypothetical protein I302_103200 [Kwoniella bestiolae CBS 10118]|uniref:Uncharacterized protein n=1 Tax=Kwoniella bestiolae CBS 10118 TaxID=1296100 RepID=A0A1B9G7Q3_9TREE|nr:hypothetical protein I302_01899 [Kwoniella bestiolae CBS 10118]OCF27064.1 hypothetical protein I302_01899 [Kwoniella bestiolae CBS 10118]